MHTSKVTVPFLISLLGCSALACGQAAQPTLAGSPGSDGGAGPVPEDSFTGPPAAGHHIASTLTPTGGDSGGDGTTAGVASATAGAAAGAPVVDPARDSTPPQLVSVKPENGAVGVSSASSVVLEFSEAMDRSSVLAAFSSETLVPSLLDATWNDAGTQLTLTPQSGLAYAQGKVTDAEALTLAAKTYGYTLTRAATDLAGNPLPEAHVGFSTLREVTHTVTPTKALTGAVVDPNDARRVFGFLSFAVAALPRGIQALERATLHVAPPGSQEAIPVFDVAFSELAPPAIVAGPGTWVGTLPSGASGDLPLPANASAFLVHDYLSQAGAPGYSQFRFQLPAEAANVDLPAVDLLLVQTSLELVYVLP